MNIDFRAYRSGNTLHLTSADLKALARTAAGGAQVSVVYPDSISIPYTSHSGYKVPVVADYKVTAGPKSALIGRPRLSSDSVRVFIAGTRLPDNFSSVTTEPIHLADLDKTTTRRVRLLGPAGSRLIPDSIDITFEVEPLIIKNRKVVIEPVNVPQDVKLITFPAQIDVIYMVPMSAYTKSEAHFRVLADYNSIRRTSKMVRLKLRDVPSNLQNVHLSADSIDITFEVEPLIIKNRKVVIEPVNVPQDVKLITFPAQIDVIYMVPMSAYTKSEAHFRVLADYNSIRRTSKMVRLKLRDVPSNLQNVHLSADSAEYIIERR